MKFKFEELTPEIVSKSLRETTSTKEFSETCQAVIEREKKSKFWNAPLIGIEGWTVRDLMINLAKHNDLKPDDTAEGYYHQFKNLHYNLNNNEK